MGTRKCGNFKHLEGIKIPYCEQGLIYFTCANYKLLPFEIQQKILNLCVKVGKENFQALFVLLTETERKIESITKEYDISLKMLCNLRKRFYEEWAKDD